MLWYQRFRGWMGLVLVGAIAIGAYAISPAVGGGPFNLKKAKKTFFTKSQSDARYAAAGSSYSKSEADGRFLARSGQTIVAFHGADWQSNGANGALLVTGPLLNNFAAHSPSTDTYSFQLPLVLPVQIAGLPQKLVSVDYCYVTHTATTIQSVGLYKPDAGPPTPIAGTSDTTSRTDDACRTLVPTAPEPLGPMDAVILSMAVDFTGSSDLQLGRVTATLAP